MLHDTFVYPVPYYGKAWAPLMDCSRSSCGRVDKISIRSAKTTGVRAVKKKLTVRLVNNSDLLLSRVIVTA